MKDELLSFSIFYKGQIGGITYYFYSDRTYSVIQTLDDLTTYTSVSSSWWKIEFNKLYYRHGEQGWVHWSYTSVDKPDETDAMTEAWAVTALDVDREIERFLCE